MPTRFATPDELSQWCGEPTADTGAPLILDLVSGAAAEAAGTAGAKWTADTVPWSVKFVVLRAATRVLTNPTDEQTEAVGGFSHTAGVYGLMLTDEERAACARAGGIRGGAARAGSTQMVRTS